MTPAHVEVVKNIKNAVADKRRFEYAFIKNCGCRNNVP